MHLLVNFLVVQPNQDCLVESVTDAFLKMHKVVPGDIIGQPMTVLFRKVALRRPKVAADVTRLIREAVRTKRDKKMPRAIDLIAGNGRAPYHVSAHPVVDGSVRVRHVVVLLEDGRTSEAESEASLRFLADALPQLIWEFDAAGQPLYFSRQWADLAGIPRHDLLGLKWHDRVHPDDVKGLQNTWKEAMQKGEPFTSEYRLLDARTQSYRWFLGSALPYKNTDGAIVRWYGTAINIDDQKRWSSIQAFLSEASKVLVGSIVRPFKDVLQGVAALAVPNIADWCTVDFYDEAGGWQQVALAHRDIQKVRWVEEYRKKRPIGESTNGRESLVVTVYKTGQPIFIPDLEAEIIRQNTTDPEVLAMVSDLQLRSVIVAPLTIKQKTVGVLSLLAADSGRRYTKEDFELVCDLAARISVALTSGLLYKEIRKELAGREELERQLMAANSELENRVEQRTRQLEQTNEGLEAEIKRREKVEEELASYSKKLALSNQELQDFAYVASHDLQEPLRKIQAFGDILETEFEHELGDAGDYVRRMRQAAKRMGTLIDDLLAFSRLTTRMQPRQKIELKTITDGVIEDLETRICDTGGKVIVSDLPIVWADQTHLRQLFQNLIGNALKFHRPGTPPVVRVYTEKEAQEDGYSAISVEDNGIGFDEKYLDRIFAVFQRLHGRDAYEGTGIGLAVCKKIVERYGGQITATSKKGMGSKFTFSLPVYNDKYGTKDDN